MDLCLIILLLNQLTFKLYCIFIKAFCTLRHGIWIATNTPPCGSPLAYGIRDMTRLTTDADAIASCPAGYSPADCHTAYDLISIWRLNPNAETATGSAWCAGTVDGALNSDYGE